MHVSLGVHRIEVVAAKGPLVGPDQQEVMGLAWPDRLRIELTKEAAPSIRLSTLWHEIGHLVNRLFNITDARKLDEEAICNLIGLAMSMIHPRDLLRLHVFAMQGYDAPDAMMLPNMPHPIPVFTFDNMP